MEALVIGIKKDTRLDKRKVLLRFKKCMKDKLGVQQGIYLKV